MILFPSVVYLDKQGSVRRLYVPEKDALDLSLSEAGLAHALWNRRSGS